MPGQGTARLICGDSFAVLKDRLDAGNRHQQAHTLLFMPHDETDLFHLCFHRVKNEVE